MILISGWAGAGKDELAKNLNKRWGFRRFAFADPLKDDVAAASGLPRHLFERPFKDQSLSAYGFPDVTPRDLVLTHAATARETDADIYARRTVEDILSSGVRRAVVSDWRLLREGEFVTDALRKQTSDPWTLIKVRVERPGVVPSANPIEHELDSVVGSSMDVCLHNTGTCEELGASLFVAK